MEVRTTKRVKIVTGFRCNANCMFCYYKDRLKNPNFPSALIKKDLDFSFKHGIREIDFSGGEPTVHPELTRLIQYAKSKGFQKVCIITNGIVLANKQYYQNLINAGLSETLFSVQGYDDVSHDSFVNVVGSFKSLLTALEHAASLGVEIRTNTVVHKRNYKHLKDICKLIVSFKPTQVNFILVNDWECAKNLIKELVCSYTEMSPYLKEACDFLSMHLSNINIRYVPFCPMLGYEKYICDNPQVKYDPYEWLPRVRVMLEKHYRWYHPYGLIGYGFLTGLFTEPVWRNLLNLRLRDFLDDCIIEAIRNYGYKKSKECHFCRYSPLCDGVEKTYAKYLGLSELRRVEGEKITAPYYFRTHLSSIDDGKK